MAAPDSTRYERETLKLVTERLVGAKQLGMPQSFPIPRTHGIRAEAYAIAQSVNFVHDNVQVRIRAIHGDPSDESKKAGDFPIRFERRTFKHKLSSSHCSDHALVRQ